MQIETQISSESIWLFHLHSTSFSHPQPSIVISSFDRTWLTITTWWTHRKTTKNWFGLCVRCWWRNIRCRTCNGCLWISSTITVAVSWRLPWRSLSATCLEAKSRDSIFNHWLVPMHLWWLLLGWPSPSDGEVVLSSQILENTSATASFMPNVMLPKLCMLHSHHRNIPKK